MLIKETYIYKKDDKIGYACGYKPKEGDIIEIKRVLYAEEGFELYKENKNYGNFVVLDSDDSQDSYSEKEIVEE